MGSHDYQDITYCANRLCPNSDNCMTSIKRLDGFHVKTWRAAWKPDGNGYCAKYRPMKRSQNEAAKGFAVGKETEGATV